MVERTNRALTAVALVHERIALGEPVSDETLDALAPAFKLVGAVLAELPDVVFE